MSSTASAASAVSPPVAVPAVSPPAAVPVVSAVVAPVLEAPPQAVLRILQQGCQTYLETTWFGIASLWYHSETGKQRAEKILKLSQIEELRESRFEHKVWLLLQAALKTASTALLGKISELFIDAPEFSQQYLNSVRDYNSRGHNFSRKEIIQSIVDKNLSACEEHPTLNDLSLLLTHLESREVINHEKLLPGVTLKTPLNPPASAPGSASSAIESPAGTAPADAAASAAIIDAAKA